MEELFRAALAREYSHAFGRADMHGLKGICPAFHIKANGVHHSEHTADSGCDRRIILDIAVDRLDPRASGGEYRKAPVGMPRGDPNDETGLVQVANDTPPRETQFRRIPSPIVST